MTELHYGFTLSYPDAKRVVQVAQALEASGWDGLFLGDAIWTMDPLIALAGAAVVTQRIRLGTMVIPAPLRVPWKLASEAVQLDSLSDGRLILGLGMGATWMGWSAFPDTVTDTKARAGMLDETIDILTLLFQRRQFDFDGQYYHLKLTTLDVQHYPPKPLQQPRVPIWIPGVWPREKSMRRVLKCDGLLASKMNPSGQFEEVKPADIQAMKAYIDAHRTLDTPFDIVVEGKTGGMSAGQMQDTLGAWAEAGATWWVESNWDLTPEQIEARIQQGAPRITPN